MTFRLYGNDYNLYTHSYLCYGKDQALRKMLALQTAVSDSVEPLSPPSLQGALEAVAVRRAVDSR